MNPKARKEKIEEEEKIPIINHHTRTTSFNSMTIPHMLECDFQVSTLCFNYFSYYEKTKLTLIHIIYKIKVRSLKNPWMIVKKIEELNRVNKFIL